MFPHDDFIDADDHDPLAEEAAAELEAEAYVYSGPTSGDYDEGDQFIMDADYVPGAEVWKRLALGRNVFYLIRRSLRHHRARKRRRTRRTRRTRKVKARRHYLTT